MFRMGESAYSVDPLLLINPITKLVVALGGDLISIASSSTSSCRSSSKY